MGPEPTTSPVLVSNSEAAVAKAFLLSAMRTPLDSSSLPVCSWKIPEAPLMRIWSGPFSSRTRAGFCSTTRW